MAEAAAGKITAELELSLKGFRQSITTANKELKSLAEVNTILKIDATDAISQLQEVYKTLKNIRQSAGKDIKITVKQPGEVAATGGGAGAAMQAEASAATKLASELRLLQMERQAGIQSAKTYGTALVDVVVKSTTSAAAIQRGSTEHKKYIQTAATATKELRKMAAAEEKLTQSKKSGSGATGKQKQETDALTIAIKAASKQTTHFANQAQLQTKTSKEAQAAIYAEMESLKKLAGTMKLTADQQVTLTAGLAKMDATMLATRGADNLNAKLMRQNLAGTANTSMMGKMGNALKSMTTNTRVAVMGVTNISEAFQKTLIGGNRMHAFLIGDLFDSLMIFSMLGGKMAIVGGVLFAIAAAAGYVAKQMGLFQNKAKAAGDATSKASASFRRAADRLVPLETNFGNANTAMDGFISRANALAGINIEKALSPMEALVNATNKLNELTLTGPQREAAKIAAWFQYARENVDMLIQRLIDLNNIELQLGGASKSREVTGQLSETANIIQDLESQIKNFDAGFSFSIGGKENQELTMLKDSLKRQLEIQKVLTEQRRQIDDERQAIASEVKLTENALAAQEAMVAKQVAAEKKLQELLKLIKSAEDAKDKKNKGSKKKHPMLDQLKAMIAAAAKLRKQIAATEAGYIKMGMAKKDQKEMVAKDPRHVMLIKQEEAIEKLVTTYEKLRKVSDKYFKNLPEDQKSAYAEELNKELKERNELYKKADKLGLKRPDLATGGPPPATLQADTEAGLALSDSLQKFGMTMDLANETGKKFAENLGGPMLNAMMGFMDSLASGVGSMMKGDFGGVMGLVGGGAGAAAAAAAGVDPMIGKAVGEQAGGFADMMISNMTVKTDVMDADGENVVLNMGELIQWEFMDQLKGAMEAFRPLAEVVFMLSSNLGGFLAVVSDMLTPILSAFAEVFSAVITIVSSVMAAMMPSFSQLIAVFMVLWKAISPLIQIVVKIVTVLMPLVSLFMFLLNLYIRFNPIMIALIAAAEALAWVLDWVNTAISGPAKKVSEAFNSVVIALGKFIMWLSDSLGGWDFLDEMGQSLIDSAHQMNQAATTDLGAFGRELDESAAAMAREINERDKATDAVKKQSAASKVLNAPQGFKVEKYRYEAMNREGMMNPYTNQPMNQQNWNIYGDITVWSDMPDEFLERLQNRANRLGGRTPSFG